LAPAPPLSNLTPAQVCEHPELSSAYDGFSHDNAVKLCTVAEQNALNQLYQLIVVARMPARIPAIRPRLYRCKFLAQGWAGSPRYWENVLGCVAGN
jgi:hypothetical protein